MSNSKWRKCFEVLNLFGKEEAVEYGRRPKYFQARWRFVRDRDRVITNNTPHSKALEAECVNHYFFLGPFYYKEIEWIEIPEVAKPHGMEKFPATFYKQDLDGIEIELGKKGQFELERTKLGLRIYGYKHART